MAIKLHLGDIVKIGRPHHCGANRWEVVRVGMDIRIKCLKCKGTIMLPRPEFEKQLVGKIK